MPMATSTLNEKSSKEAVRNAVSACISQEIKAGREDEQAIAMCLEDARKHAGSRYVPGKVTVKK